MADVAVDIEDVILTKRKDCGHRKAVLKTSLRIRNGKEGYAINIKGSKAKELADKIEHLIDNIIEEEDG